ncbi:MAG: cupin domain-containing protein [Candidatus Margulisiibacteriota bacterium]|nr:MAG: cupin [Candidatus Margulisbacteria bacterium GWD2_39_127]OGI03186.1 MAG: cupin [Candidatus Margulisbacteria bacterium GWF2_38_17]OGI11210.1 MAG: cupin [Candidatus Margulisbacteria bacterium GWE2_39_32]PZM78574.1 MAG: cupin domain-containing protein [Candidatus Margulisiibacteriota bacterium]HAR63858.1 cupin domain-containing protein [Candidatus Margulisiibacteriota bacterium]
MSGFDEKKESLIGQVKNLGELVNYQDDSVVSRMLVNAKAGTITLFAFDKGQRLSEHAAPFDAYVQVVEGEAQITISGSPLLVKSGEMVIMPANKPHAVDAQEKFKMLLVMIKSV